MSPFAEQPSAPRRDGILLGLLFLARNDCIFLIASLLLTHLYRGWRRREAQRAFMQCLVAGSLSIVVASPWLIFNVTKFGHLVPVSGRAESYGIPFGSNLPYSFPALLENALLVLRIPQSIQTTGWVTAIAVIAAISPLRTSSAVPWGQLHTEHENLQGTGSPYPRHCCRSPDRFSQSCFWP